MIFFFFLECQLPEFIAERDPEGLVGNLPQVILGEIRPEEGSLLIHVLIEGVGSRQTEAGFFVKEFFSNGQGIEYKGRSCSLDILLGGVVITKHLSNEVIGKFIAGVEIAPEGKTGDGSKSRTLIGTGAELHVRADEIGRAHV